MVKFEGIIGTIVYVSNIFCSFLSSFRAISPNYILHFVEKNSIKFSERKAKMTSPVASSRGIIPPLPSKISRLTSQSSFDTDKLSQNSNVRVFLVVLLGNYWLLELDPNFIYFRSHRTKTPRNSS